MSTSLAPDLTATPAKVHRVRRRGKKKTATEVPLLPKDDTDDANYQHVLARLRSAEPHAFYGHAAGDMPGLTVDPSERRGMHYETLQRLQRPRTTPMSPNAPRRVPLSKSLRPCGVLCSIGVAALVILPTLATSLYIIIGRLV